LTLYQYSSVKKIIAGGAGYVKIIWCCRWIFRQVKLVSYWLTVP